MIDFNTFLEINEELNYKITDELIEFEDRWFYYDEDDEIVYGCDDVPTDCLFSFNPGACKVICKGDEFNYEMNNPLCVITLKMDKTNEFAVYTEGADEFFKKELHYYGGNAENDRKELQDAIEEYDGYRIIILYGKKLVASTFDIIEEN